MLSRFHDSQPFDMGLLLFPGITLFLSLFILGYLGSRSLIIAWLIATIKTSFFILYFGVFFDGTYTSVDDEYYLITGQQLKQLFLGPIGEISIERIQGIAGSAHIVYNVINAIAFLFFGEFYFSPVIINVIVSALASVIGVTIIREQKIIPETESKYFFIFFCLHPELVSWSTVFNGKDTLVLFMNVLLLYSVSLFTVRKRIAAFISGFLAILILLKLRFYVPLMFGFSFSVYLILRKKLSLQKVLVFGLLASPFLYFVAPWGSFDYVAKVYIDSFLNPLTGALHFMLTPRPFFTDEIHGFLHFASLVNWILFPVFLIGICVGIKSRNRFIDFLFIYLLVFVMFYACFYALNGPRHRLPLLLAISIFQFIGLRWLAGQKIPQKSIGSPQNSFNRLGGNLSP